MANQQAVGHVSDMKPTSETKQRESSHTTHKKKCNNGTQEACRAYQQTTADVLEMAQPQLYPIQRSLYVPVGGSTNGDAQLSAPVTDSVHQLTGVSSSCPLLMSAK